MWIDSHCHLDALAAEGLATDAVRQAQAQGVSQIVVPAVEVANFAAVQALAREFPCVSYTLGIHPIYVPQAHEDDLAVLANAVQEALNDPQFVGIGEIGLDYFVPMLCTQEMRSKQEFFYIEQLKLARQSQLPALLHIRRSQDIVLKHLRRIQLPGAIAHAFNGSQQQAEHFIALGCKLGFGGAMSFSRALQIRRLASALPATALVLETDAPDMSPAWLHPASNSPAELAAIGRVLADLRGEDLADVAAQTSANVHAVLPRLQLRQLA